MFASVTEQISARTAESLGYFLPPSRNWARHSFRPMGIKVRIDTQTRSKLSLQLFPIFPAERSKDPFGER
jgi:hypothetical protein